MPWWGREDGDLVRDVPAYRRIMPFLMPTRTESVVMLEQKIDVDGLLPFLEAWGRTHDRPITFFHVLMWAVVDTLHERPRLNRFTMGGHLYQRRGIHLSYTVKKSLDDGAPIALVKRRFEPGQSLEQFVGQIHEGVDEGRSAKRSHVDRELDLFLRLPGPLLRWGIRLLRALDDWNLLPYAFFRDDPMYTSVVVTNLGSLKMDAPFHHLYEYGNCPIFAMIGKIEEVLVPDAERGVRTRRQVSVKWSYDERIEDGLYCARALDRLRQRVESLRPPEALAAHQPAEACAGE